MASDGERAYAVFPDGLVAALDLDGRLLWTKSFGPLDNTYGHASSLLCYNDLLIVQLDQGRDPEEKKSKILALHGPTGETRWQVERSVSASWTTPVLLRVNGRLQLVAAAPPTVTAYDPESGSEIWSVQGLGGEPAPCPTFDEHRLYAGVLGSYLFAIDPSGTGDRTQTGVVWDTSDYLPDIVSPLAANGLLFLIAPDGSLAALRADSGALVWEQQIGPTKASPVFASGHVWVVTDQGDLMAFSPGSAFQEAGRLRLGETVRASPAIVGDRIYIRGQDHLFCLGP
jgi:outer membrane protein assembly factor BamB